MNQSNTNDLKQEFDPAKDDEKLRQVWQCLEAIKAGNEQIRAGIEIANNLNRATRERLAAFEQRQPELKQQSETQTPPVQKKSFADFFWSWLKLMAIYLILSSIILSLGTINDNSDSYGVTNKVQIKRQLQLSGIYQGGRN